MTKKSIVIINNEKCVETNDGIFCENIEMKTMPEGLSNYFDVTLILRKAKINPIHKIEIQNIKISRNIFSFIYSFLKYFRNKETKYLIVSITPYTFFAYFFLSLAKKKVFLYLRSSGLDEYKLILGKSFAWVYRFMFFFMSKKSILLCVNEKISPIKDYKLLLPSQLNNVWFENTQYPNLDEIKLLYVGRIKVEKGVFSFLELFNRLKLNLPKKLTLVGHGERLNIISNNIKILKPLAKKTELIKIYDTHNIVILPSFTEGHPQVLLEALARKRPVIIFKDIDFVKKDYNGVFICKRDSDDLQKTIHYIIKNYNEITKSMTKNKLPMKEEFIKQLVKFLS